MSASIVPLHKHGIVLLLYLVTDAQQPQNSHYSMTPVTVLPYTEQALPYDDSVCTSWSGSMNALSIEGETMVKMTG